MDIVQNLAFEFAKVIVSEAAKECFKKHKEDIQNAANRIFKAFSQAYQEGLQRDYNAGGISSWRKQYRTATA